MTDIEQIIALTIEQANLAHPETPIHFAFGMSNEEEKHANCDPDFSQTIEVSALMQFKGHDFNFLFGGPPHYQQFMVYHKLRPAPVITLPQHWKAIAMIASHYGGAPAVAVPYIQDGMVHSLAYPFCPMAGFKWWFLSSVFDKLLLASERLLANWDQEI